jgi:hypothetical protein
MEQGPVSELLGFVRWDRVLIGVGSKYKFFGSIFLRKMEYTPSADGLLKTFEGTVVSLYTFAGSNPLALYPRYKVLTPTYNPELVKEVVGLINSKAKEYGFCVYLKDLDSVRAELWIRKLSKRKGR